MSGETGRPAFGSGGRFTPRGPFEEFLGDLRFDRTDHPPRLDDRTAPFSGEGLVRVLRLPRRLLPMLRLLLGGRGVLYDVSARSFGPGVSSSVEPPPSTPNEPLHRVVL